MKYLSNSSPVFNKTTRYAQSYSKTNKMEDHFTIRLRAMQRFIKRLKLSV
jgi:hypothetical protein